MPHETTAWRCDFCHRCFSRKVDATNHEYACKHNPARRMCFTCKHFVPKGKLIRTLSEEEIEIQKIFYGDESTTREYVAMKCNHFGVPMTEKPYFIKCDYVSYGVTDCEAEPIPGSCLYWEPKEPEVE